MEPARGTRAGFSRSIGVNTPGSGEAGMTSDERCNLVLALARTLFVNGQATDQTAAAAERLARAVGLSAGAGAALRRAVARLSDNDFMQPFCVAILAGFAGALAVRYHLSTSLRLVP